MKFILLNTLLFLIPRIDAVEINVDIEVAGQIMDAPQWQDTGAVQITSLVFDFSNFQAGDAARNVDSGSQSVILSDPANASGSLSATLATPTGCQIGGSNVNDVDVFLMFNASEQANASSINISEGITNTLELRFSSAGSYGDKSGLVSCASSGTLTYTY